MRMTSLWVCTLAVAGCTDDEPTADPYKCLAAGGAACFELPTMPIGAYKPDPDGTDGPLMGMAVPPVLDCAAHEITTGPVTFTGKTVSLLNEATAVPDVRIEAFSDLALGTTIGDVTSDDMGAYSLVMNTPSVVFGRATGAGTMPFHYLYQRIDVTVLQQDMFNFVTATKPQIESVIELAGAQWLASKSQVAAVTADCAGNRLVNVVGNVSQSPSVGGSRGFEEGVRVFYQIAGSVAVLGRRTEQIQTTTAGGIALTNLSPGRHYVQLWGFASESDVMRGSAGLRLISEREIIVPGMETAIGVRLDGRF